MKHVFGLLLRWKVIFVLIILSCIGLNTNRSKSNLVSSGASIQENKGLEKEILEARAILEKNPDLAKFPTVTLWDFRSYPRNPLTNKDFTYSETLTLVQVYDAKKFLEDQSSESLDPLTRKEAKAWKFFKENPEFEKINTTRLNNIVGSGIDPQTGKHFISGRSKIYREALDNRRILANIGNSSNKGLIPKATEEASKVRKSDNDGDKITLSIIIIVVIVILFNFLKNWQHYTNSCGGCLIFIVIITIVLLYTGVASKEGISEIFSIFENFFNSLF